MIVVREVSRQFGEHTAVQEVSFTVGERETLVLLGTSGCGKTTMLKMINRLIEPSRGSIEINGTDIRRQQAHLVRRQIGYVIQDTGLFPHYTVGENMATVPRLLRWDEARIRNRSRELLTMLHLPETFLNRYPADLSGGQRQRVGLARALAAQPAILLMDEPLGALDPVTRAGIRREFRQLDELRQKTTILVTHDVQEAFELGDRIGLMDGGRLLQLGTPKELLLRPANAFVRNFLHDQRLFLQLRTFTLADLAPYLPAVDDPPPGANVLPPATNLADVLEEPTDSGPPYFTVANRLVSADPSAIWSGLRRLTGPNNSSPL